MFQCVFWSYLKRIGLKKNFTSGQNKAILLISMYNLLVAKNHFFKPVFYRSDDESILFKFNTDLELISLPQFTIKREIKTEEDLRREMGKLEDFMKKLGITYLETPFFESKIETLDGKEKAFFFFVNQVSTIPLSDDYTWINADEAMVNEDIAWWDRNAIIAYIPSVLKN